MALLSPDAEISDHIQVVNGVLVVSVVGQRVVRSAQEGIRTVYRPSNSRFFLDFARFLQSKDKCATVPYSIDIQCNNHSFTVLDTGFGTNSGRNIDKIA